MKRLGLCLVLFSIFVCNAFAAAELERAVTGSACYQYGDNETPLSAKKMATELAKRSAMENYVTYVTSTTKMDNFELKRDSIITAGSSFLHDMKIINDQKKDREYCISIAANVRPDEVRDLMKIQLADVKTYADKNSNQSSDGKVSLDQWNIITQTNASDSVERVKDGEINWSKRVIRVTGFGAANKSFPKHVWKKDAEDNAILDAQTKILEITKGVDLEAKRYIENYQTREQSARKSVQGRVKKAQQVGKTKFSAEEDTAEVVMEAKLPE